jgi:hypothetical protein
LPAFGTPLLASATRFERRILFVCRKTFEAKGTLKILGKHFMPVIMTASGAQAQPLLNRRPSNAQALHVLSRTGELCRYK